VTKLSIAEVTTEIRAWCVEKGWRGPQAPSRKLMVDVALMHSEVSEALEAYRVKGTNRWSTIEGDVYPLPFNVTDSDEFITQCDEYGYVKDAKPEGVPSEIADVFIRLLDNAAEQSIIINMEEPGSKVRATFEKYKDEDFGFHAGLLHDLISRISANLLLTGGNRLDWHFSDIAIGLQVVSEMYGFDLYAEVERKMAYNWTRTYRHGGKLL
jgi:hypothetical protein